MTLFLAAISLGGYALPGAQGSDDGWLKTFLVDKKSLSAMGRNDYFILEPGYSLEYKGDDVTLVITVLKDTELVDGVVTRVVEERETNGGRVVEVSRNFFAIDRDTKDVYYFGEDVNIFKAGKVISHEGAWRSGKNGAKFGLMMPGKPKVGMAFYQEVAPKVAMDRAKVLGTSVTVKTPAGEFRNCLKTEETTPVEPGAKEFKYYAPGIGLIQDSDLKLVKKP